MKTTTPGLLVSASRINGSTRATSGASTAPAPLPGESPSQRGHSGESRFEPVTAHLGAAWLGGLIGCAPKADARLTAIKQELQKAPAGSQANKLLNYLNTHDVDIQFRSGGGSEYLGGTIYLDTEGRSPADQAISLAHEFVHYLQPGPRVGYQTKEKWLAQSIAEEKTACLAQFQAAKDIGALATSEHPAVRYFRDDCRGDVTVWERSFDAGEVLTGKKKTYVDHYKTTYEELTGEPYDQ